MPRRSRARDTLEEEVYDRDRDLYPRHGHGRGRDRRRIFKEEEEELKYERRVPPPPPPPPLPMAVPVERLERLRLREERARGPEMIVPVPPPPPKLVREEVKVMPVRRPLRDMDRGFERERDWRGRTRYRGVDLEKERFVLEEVEEEEEEEEEGSSSESESSSLEESDTEEEEDMVVVPRKGRPKQRLEEFGGSGAFGHGHDQDHPSRSKSLKEGFRGARDPRFEQDEVLKRYHERNRSGPVYARSQHRHHSHRHRDLEDADSELEEEVDEEVFRRKLRERRHGGHVVEEEEIRRSSSEMERSGPPSPKRFPAFPERHVYEESRKIYPPRPPNPDFVYESETHHRERSSRGRLDRTEIPIIRPKKKSGFPAPHPDPYRRSKDGLPLVPPEPKIAEREKEVLTVVRRDGSHESLKEEEFLEEDYYAPPDPRHFPKKVSKEKRELDFVGPGHRAKHDRAAPDIDALRYPDRTPKHGFGEPKHSDSDSSRQFGRIGRRYVGVKDRRERLWTEITRDLVVKEALERAGYEYEETETSYFIFTYLDKEEVDALIEHSEDIRRARRRRVQEIHRERTALPGAAAPIAPPPPPPPASDKTGPLLLDSPPPRFPREERRRTEREMVAEGGRWRPPPPRPERW
ncbi:uncharacterized protein BO97DRAFT_52709 [Aspergillus homomorphus CBS 101889]|uniref:DUF8035 domain-containing protein n=1 Tax=Aspergillus homomorphus (strain CBS 101889) TaxID=1450537 RepID=A0A395HZ07_ASPHC|nr:hypothetical protein BO97DRAFT_52709 [Aspergillus homomorphus CBS 101889]RAL12705.1 hypothetical protein BO97DRAFT_52709 [Aspergillus homomorphus CBS 101889]